jgi:hypothetical protein
MSYLKVNISADESHAQESCFFKYVIYIILKITAFWDVAPCSFVEVD